MKRKVAVVLVVALIMAFAVAPAIASPFPDVSSKHWAYDAVNVLYAAGIIEGYPDGELKGDSDVTRYEMIAIVARSLQWLNDRVEEEVKESKEENMAVLESIIGEAMEAKFGKYPSPDKIAQAIADISEIEEKFSKELDLLKARVDELEKSDINSKEIQALSETLETQLGTADVRLTSLEKQLALYTSELTDVKAALQEALKRMDRINVTGQTKVDLAMVELNGPKAHFEDKDLIDEDLIPDIGNEFSKFTNTLNLRMQVNPDNGLSIVSDIGIKNNLGASDEDQLAFAIDSLKIAVEAEDFVGTFGNLDDVTFSDLILKDWSGEGALITLKNESLKGTSALFARDEANSWIQGFTGAVELDDAITLSGTYVKRSNEEPISGIGINMDFLEGLVNLSGQYAQSGSGNDKIAVKLGASAEINNVDTDLSYTKIGASYNPFGVEEFTQEYLADATVAEEKKLNDKAIFNLRASTPLDFFDGLTLENSFKHTRRISTSETEMLNTTSLVYNTKLADFNDSDMTLSYGVTIDDTSIVSNNIFASVDWNLYDNLELFTRLIKEKGNTVDTLDLYINGAYDFKVTTFDGRVKYAYNKYVNVIDGENWYDLIAGLTFGRTLTKNANMEVGYEKIKHTDVNDSSQSASATVVKAGLAISF